MEKQIIQQGKNAVYIQDHLGLKKLYQEINTQDYTINFANIFLKLFYNACQLERKSTIIFYLEYILKCFLRGNK